MNYSLEWYFSQVSRAPRSYDSPRRRAAAEESRRRIVDTAGRLFLENGYSGTSVQAIAAAAGTSPANIYLVFGTKAALLAAWIDVSVAGDDTPVMFVDRPEARALAALPTVDDRLAAALSIGTAAYERVAAPLAVLDAAAQGDPAIAALAAGIDAARRQDIGQLLGVVFAELPSRKDMSREEIVDLVSALLSPHLYRALVLTAGWKTARYERELARQNPPLLPRHRPATNHVLAPSLWRKLKRQRPDLHTRCPSLGAGSARAGRCRPAPRRSAASLRRRRWP